jgi:hypothetical protein
LQNECYLHNGHNEGNLWKNCGFFFTTAFTPKAALAFLAGSSVVGLGTQRVKPHIKKHGKLNSNTLPIKGMDQFVCHIFGKTLVKL